MLSETPRWICTNRRSEADVMKELAATDTPVVILTRDEPTRMEQKPFQRRHEVTEFARKFEGAEFLM